MGLKKVCLTPAWDPAPVNSCKTVKESQLFRYGVGSRIKLRFTRAIINAIHSGELAMADVSPTPIFELQASGSQALFPSQGYER